MFGSFMEDPSRKTETKMDYVKNLDQSDMVQVMYVWIDGSGEGLRAKTKTMRTEPKDASDCPEWNYDGSSTAQAAGKNSDVYLRPCRLFKDPFRLGRNKILMCDTVKYDGKPTHTNNRDACVEVMKKVDSYEPLFMFEQQFVLMERDRYPLGWPKNGFPKHDGPYFCGVGANNVFGRDVMEAAYCACLYAGISIDGSNPDIMPAQWCFKIGPCRGIDMGDELWMARFILTRVAEDFGVLVSFDPKPIPGRWNGSGAHCNFSTKKMRNTGGIKDIEDALDKLAPVHKLHLQHYDPKGGADITRRMEGADDDIIDDMAQFTAYKASRRGSVRIPQNVGSQGMGYLEDRRPASNCDPYSVTEILVRTTILAEYESHEEPIEEE